MIFDFPVLGPLVVCAVVFIFAVGVNRRLRLWSRLVSAGLFGVGAYVAVRGGMASYIFSSSALRSDEIIWKRRSWFQ